MAESTASTLQPITSHVNDWPPAAFVEKLGNNPDLLAASDWVYKTAHTYCDTYKGMLPDMGSENEK